MPSLMRALWRSVCRAFADASFGYDLSYEANDLLTRCGTSQDDWD
jgi:hypothetical protein